MPDPRRPAVLGLILEWDPEAGTLPKHLGLTPEAWLAFHTDGTLPDGYQPREPRERYEPEPHPPGPGRPAGHFVPAETKGRIRELTLQGRPSRWIAQECGVSQNTVLAIARKLKEESAHA